MVEKASEGIEKFKKMTVLEGKLKEVSLALKGKVNKSVKVEVMKRVAIRTLKTFLTYLSLSPAPVTGLLEATQGFELSIRTFYDLETDETAADVLAELKAWKVLASTDIPWDQNSGEAVLDLLKSSSLDTDLRRSTLLHFLLQSSSDLVSSPYHRKNFTREAYAAWVVKHENEAKGEVQKCLEEWRKRTEGKETVERDKIIEVVVMGLM
jgi:hypothetical protein